MSGGFLRVIATKDLVTGDLKERLAKAGKAAGCGIFAVANEVARQAQRRTPVKRGILRGSAVVTHPVGAGNQVSCTVGFGGPAKAYALAQHENLTWKHPGGGEAKYLEKAADAVLAGAAGQIFLDAVDRFFKNGTPPPSSFPAEHTGGGGAPEPGPAPAAGGAKRRSRTGRTR